MCRNFAFRVYITSKSELDYMKFILFSNVLLYGCTSTKILRPDEAKSGKTNKQTAFGLFYRIVVRFVKINFKTMWSTYMICKWVKQ